MIYDLIHEPVYANDSKWQALQYMLPHTKKYERTHKNMREHVKIWENM